MIASVCLVAALLVLTKLCDVVSTLQQVKHPDGETNPIAREAMLRIGTRKAVWVVFALAIIIIGLSGWAALNGGKIVQALFIVLGVAISVP